MNAKTLVLVAVLHLAALSHAASCAQQEVSDSPLRDDPTGINWVFSLEDALQKARETDRIVLLKPVSYRSVEGSSDLCPSAETQRAIAFVDSRVVNLINRRFVPYYFDLEKGGALYDEQAAQLALSLFPEIRFSTMPTPPMLLMTPGGKLLTYCNNFLDGDEFLLKIGELFEEHPSYKELSVTERVETDRVKRAWIHYELRNLDEAVKLLEKQASSEANYLRVLIAREQRNWMAMKKAINLVTDTHRKLDIDVENILRYWTINNLAGIIAKGSGSGRDSRRYQEGMY